MIKRSLALLAGIAVLAACSTEQSENLQETAVAAIAEEESSIIPGELVVQFSEEAAAILESGAAGTKGNILTTSLEEAGVISYERLYEDGGKWEARHRAAGLHRWYRVKYDSTKEPATKAQSGIESIDGVVYVEPVRRIQNTAVFNDPYFGQQWDLYNDGTQGSKYTAGADINVVPVWQTYTTGSKDVVVAIIDEGVDLEHEDLASNCIPASVTGSKCFLYDYSGYTIYPGDHGSHVAGTVAAINNNGKGVCGIAGGDSEHPGARIMSCQILRSNSETGKTDQGDAYNALIWAADHGAVIAQNSWGYQFDSEAEASEGDIGSFSVAVDYFNKFAGCDEDGNQLSDSPMKGGIVIFAAGNDGWGHAWPAEYEGILAVGAMSSIMTRTYYSNYGEWVDICAPGGDAYVGPTIYNCTAGNSYGSMQGTSMACPHVSGVAALIVSYFGGLGFTRDMLWDRLINGANAGTALRKSKIGPLVDALGSFTYGSSIAPEKVTDFTASAKSNNITLSWKATADEDNLKAYAYLLLFSKDKAELESVDPKHVPSTVKSAVIQGGSAEVGEDISGTVADFDFDTDYWCSIIAYDYSQNYAAASPAKKVHTEQNNPPLIETSYTGDYKIKTFETLRVEYRISDPDGHKFTINTEPGSSAASIYSTNEESVTVVTLTIVGRDAEPGSYTADIVAFDAYGAKTEYPVSYTILENHPPKVVSQIDNILIGTTGETQTLDLSKYFYDEDGESLTYTFEYSTQNVVHCAASQDNLSITSIGYGVTDVTVTAADALGKSCSTTFKVAVRDSSVPVLLYPNPVSTVLNVSTADEASAEIRVVSKAGATVREVKQNVSPFEPAVIDMKDCPAGVYSVVFKGGSIDERYTIVKK